MRRLLKYTAILFGVIIATVVIGLYILTQTSFLRNRAESYLNQTLARSTKLSVDVGDLGGSYTDGITVDSIVLMAHTDGSPDTLAVIPRLEIDYSVGEIVAGLFRIRQLTIQSPRFYVPRDSIVEYWTSLFVDTSSGESTGGPPFLFSIDTLRVVDGAVLQFEDSVYLAQSIDLALGAGRDARGIRVQLYSASAAIAKLGDVTARGEGHVIDDDVAVDSLRVRTTRSSIRVSGAPDHWQIQSSPLDLADVESFVSVGIKGVLDFDGSIQRNSPTEDWKIIGVGSGQLEGYSLNQVRVRASFGANGVVIDSLIGGVSGGRMRGSGKVDWSVEPLRWSFWGSILNFNLDRFAPGTISTDLSGRVNVSGAGSTSRDLVIHADLDLTHGHCADIPFDEAYGSIVATVDSLLISDDFRVSTRQTRIRGAGHVAFEDSVDIVASFDCDDLSAWDDLVFVDSLGGQASGFAYLFGKTEDPDLSGVLNSDTLHFEEVATRDFAARFFVPRFSTDRSGSVEARIGTCTVWDIPTDSISLGVALSGTRVAIDSLVWSTPQFDIDGGGWLDWSTDTIPLVLYPLTTRWEGENYSAADSVRLRIDPHGITIDTLAFEGPLGILNADGRYAFDGTIEFYYAVDQFRLRPVAQRFAPRVRVDGYASARGSILGTKDDPHFDLDARVSTLEYEDRAYGDLETVLSYDDRRLTVNRFNLTNPDFTVDISGQFPIDLRMGTVERRLLDEPMKGRLIMSGEVLDRIAAFKPDLFESIRGPFAVSATLSGTPQTPHLIGEAHLRAGTIKLLELANPLTNTQIDLVLSQDTIVITRAVTTMQDGKKTGTVNATGTIQIVSYDLLSYDLDLSGKNVPLRLEFVDWFIATKSLDLKIDGATPPLLSGHVEIERFDDREPFSDDQAPSVPDTAVWDWDVVVDIPGNYWIHNDQIEAELAAQLRIVRQEGLLNLTGQADIVRGKVYLLDKVGRIERGVLRFDDPDKLDPSLDIDVAFRIQQPRTQTVGAGASSEAVTLKLHVAGRASEPLIQPEAPYTEEDVLLLLTANTTTASGEDDLANRLKFAATGLVFSEVQRVVAQRLGFETLAIESDAEGGNTYITVGRYFSPQFYLYGASPIDAGAGQEVGFEYRFSRRVFLEGNRDRYNSYRLNLHFNWDY